MRELIARRPLAALRLAAAGTALPRRIVVRARSRAAPDEVWALLADTRRWHTWAPHIAGVRTAEPGIVRPGQRLRVRSPVGVAVPATVTLVDPGRRWDFRVGLPGPWSLVSRHDVRRCEVGSEALVTMWVEGPAGPASLPALLAYRPLADLAVQRLARLAGEQARSAPD